MKEKEKTPTIWPKLAFKDFEEKDLSVTQLINELQKCL